MFWTSFPREREKVALLLDEAIRRHLSELALPEVNDTLESVYGDYAIGNYTQTHEMRFFINDRRAFTAKFIQRLQLEVLRRHKHWSLVPQFNEREITVFHDAVLLGKRRIKGSVSEQTPEFREWIEETERFDEYNYGSLRRQIAFIRSLMPDALARLTRQRFVILGVFDQYQPNFPGYPIWILQRDRIRELSLNAEAIHESAVGFDGELYPTYYRMFQVNSEPQPVGWLAAYLADAVHGRTFVMKSNEQIVEAVVLPAQITDEELKRRMTIG
jgi:hypothetical protein